jgi:hypothetical protein
MQSTDKKLPQVIAQIVDIDFSSTRKVERVKPRGSDCRSARKMLTLESYTRVGGSQICEDRTFLSGLDRRPSHVVWMLTREVALRLSVHETFAGRGCVTTSRLL